MKRAIILVAAGAAVLSTAALAARPSPLSPPPAVGTGLPPGQCIRTHDIGNHTIADRNTVLLEVNRQIYRVTVNGSCLAGAIDSDPIITRQPPGSNIICKPIDLDLSVTRGHGFETRCIIDSIVKMPPEEVAALPRGLKP